MLEGPSFDRQGNLLFVDAGRGRVLRLTPDRQLSVVVPGSPLGASGTAIHKDGRIFIAAVGDLTNLLPDLRGKGGGKPRSPSPTKPALRFLAGMPPELDA